MDKQQRDRVYIVIEIIQDIERMRTTMAEEQDDVVSLANRRKQAEQDAWDDKQQEAKEDYYDFEKLKALNEQRHAKVAADRIRANDMVKRNYNLRTKKK